MRRSAAPSQLAPEGQHHGDEAGAAAHQVGDGLRPEDTFHPHKVGQDEDEGHHHHQFAEDGEENGVAGPAQRREGGLAGKLQGHETKAEEVNMHHPGAHFHQLGIVVEDPNELMGEQKHHAPGHQGIGHADACGEQDALFHPRIFLCAVVIAQHRLGAAGDAVGGHGHHLPDGVDDGHGADVHIAPQAAEGPVVGKLGYAVGKGHHKMGKAQLHRVLENIRLPSDAFPPQLQQCFFPRQKPHDPPGGQDLGDHRGHGRSPHAHIQPKDQKGIQHHVHRRSGGNGDHTRAAEALAVDEAVHPQAHHSEEGAPDVNGKVVLGIGEGILAGAEEPEDGIHKRYADGCQHQGRHRQHEAGGAHDLLRLGILLPSPGDGAQGRAAHAVEVGKGGDDIDDGKDDAHPGQGQGGGGASDPADEKAVRDIVEHVHQLGYGHGDRHCQNIAGHAAFTEIMLFSHGIRAPLTVLVTLPALPRPGSRLLEYGADA